MLCRQLLVAAATVGLVSSPLSAVACPDLALVLAIDNSGSIDPREYRLQTMGLADALRNPEVRAAIESAGQVSMAAVFWGDSGYPIQVISWFALDSDDAINDFALRLETNPREVAGGTDLGSGVWAALDKLEVPGVACAPRRMINVTGDGRETLSPRRSQGVSVLQAKRRAEAMGVTINALAVADEDPTLGKYFSVHLITGPDAFVMEIRDHADFVRAILEKLVREIQPPALAQGQTPVQVALAAVPPKPHRIQHD
jgi:hypothetical protein